VTVVAVVPGSAGTVSVVTGGRIVVAGSVGSVAAVVVVDAVRGERETVVAVPVVVPVVLTVPDAP
jgi:hypothetical protein